MLAKTVLDSGFQGLDTGFFFASHSGELGFRIPIDSGVLDSLSCIPNSKALIQDSTSKNFLDIGIRIPLAAS